MGCAILKNKIIAVYFLFYFLCYGYKDYIKTSSEQFCVSFEFVLHNMKQKLKGAWPLLSFLARVLAIWVL